MLNHAADLAVEALHQCNAEDEGRFLFHGAALGHYPQDGHAMGHFGQHPVGEGAVHRHEVLFFVLVAGPQNLVYNVAVAGQENQALRLLIEAADGENAGGMVHVVHNVAAHARLRCGGDTHRLVESQVDGIGGLPRFQLLAVHRHAVAGANLVAYLGRLAVHQHRTLGNVAVGFAARANAAFADEFVEADGGNGRHNGQK